ncbi:virion structural protein [Pseudomonas phage Phabio]|uniref:Virion structural protein n=1 Tax=Pseudomonas phage Phabio TaxID=2006668 RepID=A0A1Y0SZX1_9CAUD|nr:virion structural protein [Pseudomonas phage Phabio]ARV76778.1 virion structural protein [Pseudomonas phage Phabio]
MSMDSTLLYKEIDRVLTKGDTYYSTRMDITICANKKWLKPVRFDYYQVHRDYSSGQLGDLITVEFLMQLGDYAFDLLPYREDLLVEVTEVPLVEASSGQDWNRQTITTRYKGVMNISGDDNAILTNKQSAMTSKEAMNQIGMKPVTLQLVDDLTYKMMMMSCGTTLKQTTTMDALIALYTKYSKLILGNRGLPIKVSPGYSTAIRSQIPFPDGMLLNDTMRFLQNEEGGIYPTGCGRYIQDQVLYIYPLFDTTMYRKNSRVLNIINVPNDRFKGSEKTFLATDRSVTILATGNTSLSDEGIARKIQDGNGLRFGDANKIFDGFGTMKDGRMLIDRATNINEVVAQPLAGGINNVRWSADRFTSNSCKQYTVMAQKAGQPFEIEWLRGDASLLEPGMAVKYQVIVDYVVKTYYGVLLGTTDTRAPTDGAVISAKFGSTIKLAMFLSRTAEDPAEAEGF